MVVYKRKTTEKPEKYDFFHTLCIDILHVFKYNKNGRWSIKDL